MKKIQVQIAEPCHEDWDKMTPDEKGRFCGSCQKTVVDFTGMSDEQVFSFFRKPSTGQVCGRFHTDQLNRDFSLPQKRMPWLKYVFQFAIPIFLTSMKCGATQGKVVVKEELEYVMPGEYVKVIKGRFTNWQKIPLSFSTVKVKGTKDEV